MKSNPVILATLQGLADAKKKYDEWSGGCYLHGAEYVATFCVAQAVYELDSVGYVTFENNVRGSIEDAGGNLRGISKAYISDRERFDIAVWNRLRKPRVTALIEIKTSVFGPSYLKKDIDKICRALRRIDTKCFGLIAYFASFRDGARHKTAKERVEDRTSKVFSGSYNYRNKEYGFSAVRHPSDVRVEKFTDENGFDYNSAWTVEVLQFLKGA